MELDHPSTTFKPAADRRPRMPEPPPVRLSTIDDAHLLAPAGVERQLDAFYRDILRFEREQDVNFPIYRSENFRVIFDVVEPPITRNDLRPLAIEVPSLAHAEQQLIEEEIEYIRQRGLLPGQDALILLNPAGNWIEIVEVRGLW
jgi:hypothetical protein